MLTHSSHASKALKVMMSRRKAAQKAAVFRSRRFGDVEMAIPLEFGDVDVGAGAMTQQGLQP